VQEKIARVKGKYKECKGRVLAAESAAADTDLKLKRSYADMEQRAKEQYHHDIEEMERRLHEKYEALIQAKVRAKNKLPRRLVSPA
jgi:hypothetical protein